MYFFLGKLKFDFFSPLISTLQDGKADGEKNESFSDAMIAEMEASVYGLQVLF